jgi:hypothetical protein
MPYVLFYLACVALVAYSGFGILDCLSRVLEG